MEPLSKRIRLIRDAGWLVEMTGGSHLKCMHPEAAHPVYTACTPRNRSQWWRRLRGDFRRALRKKRV